MLLENKNAVIYGGGGAIGGAVARVFAREGARVFIAGLKREKLDAVAADIAAAGGRAETAQVDAFDQRAVEKHADAVAAKAGSIESPKPGGHARPGTLYYLSSRSFVDRRLHGPFHHDQPWRTLSEAPAASLRCPSRSNGGVGSWASASGSAGSLLTCSAA